MSKPADDAKLAELLGITDAGFGPDAMADMAFTLLALIEETGADLSRLLATKQRLIERMTKQRTLLQDQRSKEGIAEAKRLGGIIASFQQPNLPQHARGA